MALILAIAAGAVVTAGAARWTLRDGSTLRAVVEQAAAATGLTLEVRGAASLRLLPRPTVEFQDVSLRAQDGAIRVDAEQLRGRLDLLALFTGGIRLARVMLERPTVSLDVDRLRSQIEPMLGAQPSRLAGLLHTGGLTVHDGLIRTLSADPAADAVLTEVSASLAWPVEGAGASLAGTATWRGVAVTGALDLDRPDALMTGAPSLASFRMKSAPLDLQIIATLSRSGGLTSGRIEASTAELSSFLRLIDHPAPQLGGIARAKLEGSLAADGTTLSIGDATLTLEDMQFEGALAVRRKGDRPALAATLATDRIDLNRFLGELPSLTGRDGQWAERALDTAAIADDDVDLRVSAAQAELGPFRIDDSSLSLQSGEGRLELSLGEARAYDGLLKARIVARVQDGSTTARVDAALSRLDLRKLLRDAGEPHGSGILTGRLGIEASGSTAAMLAGTTQGRGELTVRDGNLDAVGARILVPRVIGSPAATADPPGSAFDDASARFRVGRGQLVLGDSWITWPEARAIVSGTASLPDQQLDLHIQVAPTAGEGQGLGYVVGGPWRDLQLTPARPPS